MPPTSKLNYVCLQHNFINMRLIRMSACQIIIIKCDLKYVASKHNYIYIYNILLHVLKSLKGIFDIPFMTVLELILLSRVDGV